MGRRLRVLLLDFDAKFTLLIPNIEPGKAFRINKADVEVQTKDLEGGHKLTFMKFLFQSPQLEIKAPVLNDKEVGYRVLSQNGACVFLKRILTLPGQGAPGQVPQGPGQVPHPQSQVQHPQGQLPHHYQPPGLSNGAGQIRSQYPEYPPAHMNHPPQSGGYPPQAPGYGGHAPSQLPSQVSPPISNGHHPPSQSPYIPPQTSTPTLSPLSTNPATSQPPQPSKPPETETIKEPAIVSKPSTNHNQPRTAQNFFELYKALNEEDYTKMTTCTFCQRKFRFTSVLIDHMSSHTVNVENIVEMKLKIWVNGSKLKCSEPGCKKKFAYTLEYTRHRDAHLYSGLQCSVCGSPQSGPAAYAAHLKEEHQEHLYSTETHQDDLVPPPNTKKKDQQALVRVPDIQESPSPVQPITPGYVDSQQVHTPLSAPPVMTASPQSNGHVTPMSPGDHRQPMSAPPTSQFSDADLDQLSAISNMPIIEDEALAPSADQTPENDELMDILNDLKNDLPQQDDLNQYQYPNQSEPDSASGFNQSPPVPSVPPPPPPSQDPHPIILSPRHSPVMTEKPSPVFGDFTNVKSPYQDINPVPFPTQDTTVPSPISRAPGVIKRNPSFSEQCFTPPPSVPSPASASSPSASNTNMTSFTNPSPIQQQPSPLTTHSFPFDNTSQDSTSQGMLHSQEGNIMMDSSQVPTLRETTPDFSGSGSHPSLSTRALLASAIRGRKSRSSSFNSDCSGSSTSPIDSAPSLHQSMMPQQGHLLQPTLHQPSLQGHPLQSPLQNHPLSMQQSPLQNHPLALQQSPLQGHPLSMQQSPMQDHPMTLQQQTPLEDYPLHQQSPLQNHPSLSPLQDHPSLSPLQDHPLSPLEDHPLSPLEDHPLSPLEDHPLSPLQDHPLSPLQDHPLLNTISDPSTQCLSQSVAEFDSNHQPYQNHQTRPFGTNTDHQGDPSTFDFEDDSSLLPSTITNFSVATRSAPVPAPLVTVNKSSTEAVGNKSFCRLIPTFN